MGTHMEAFRQIDGSSAEMTSRTRRLRR